MHRAALCCFVTVTFATTAALAQRAPTRRTPPPVNRPAPRQPAPTPQAPTRQVPAPSKPSRQEKPNAAGDSGPARPAGFKPITLTTAQKETDRLRTAIEKLEQRLKAKEEPAADPAEKPANGDESATTNADATTAASKVHAEAKAEKESTSPGKERGTSPRTAAEKRTVAGIEIENRSLRRQVDALLLKVAEKEGTIPERPAGLPKYDPHVIDSPTNADFCPGKTLQQLEDTMRFAGFPVGESEDGAVCYEWIFHIARPSRGVHSTHRVWAIMKDGISAEVKQAAPGVVKEGPAPKFTPTR